ncbi:MAG: hypothetical protein ABWK01_07125 [Infirmifilum sp.]
MEGWVLSAPRLRMARLKLANRLLDRTEAFSGVALPYPKELESILNLYAKGTVSFQRVVEVVRDVFRGHASGWLWVEKPLLLVLPQLGARVECYLRTAGELLSHYSELLALTLRTRITGKIKLDEWRMFSTRAEVTPRKGWITIVNGMPRSTHAVDVWKLPYPPPETLDARTITDEAVKEYVDYVFNYIVQSRNLDEAYLKWLEERKNIRVHTLWKLLRLISE